jgi:hypothetical protein
MSGLFPLIPREKHDIFWLSFERERMNEESESPVYSSFRLF